MTMRISSNQMTNNAIERLRTRLSQYERVQSQLASGKSIERPSDDPAMMNSIMSLKSSQRSIEQVGRNSQEATTWINLADSKLQDASEAMRRAKELLVRAASPMTSEERAAIATELEGIQNELLATANSRHQGQGLFAGFAATNAVSGGSGSWSYTGDAGQMVRRIGEGETVTVQLNGSDVFGFSLGAGQDVFSALDRAIANVTAGDPTAISNSMAEVEGASARIGDGLARLGAVGARLERAILRNSDEQITVKSELSQMEDVDLAEMVLELQMQEVAYQATLGAISKAITPSLADFLR